MGSITDVLKEFPLSAVLKEQLVEAKERLVETNKKIESLQSENGNLRQLIQQKDQEIVDLSERLEGQNEDRVYA